MYISRFITLALVAFVTFGSFADAAQVQTPPTDDTDVTGQNYCPSLSQTLRRGMRDANTGGQVTELQSFLADYYDLGASEISGGFFGRLTQGYVIKFQNEQSLPAYGIVGSLTRARIADVCASTGPVISCPVYNRVLCTSDQIYVDGVRDSRGCLSQGYCKTKPAVTPNEPDAKCKVWFDGCNTCSRAYVGGQLMCTQMSCVQGWDSSTTGPVRYCKEYFTNTSDIIPPSITGFSGPTQLSVSEQGTWRVQASDNGNGTLKYSIDWGDQLAYPTSTSGATALRWETVTQQTTFTHTYTSGGFYTVNITVRDEAGNSVNSSATVSVGGAVGSCTTQYAPVCGERQVCAANNGYGLTGSGCWGEKKTYGNKCQMALENASFVSEGECQGTIGGYTPPSNCKSWYDGCNTCGRSSEGGAGFCTLKACQTVTAGYCTSYFGGEYVGDLSITPTAGKVPVTVTVTGPTALLNKINAGGTNTGFGGCGYTLAWGDGTTSPSAGQACSAGLTHAYSVVGTKTVQATLWHPGPTDGPITDWKGSTHVTLTSGGCTKEYAPYCGQPPMPTCPTGMSCVMAFPAPVTYGNKCLLTEAGATVISAGVCSGSQSCTDNGQTYTEGQTITCLHTAGGGVQCIADAVYICKAGSWITQGTSWGVGAFVKPQWQLGNVLQPLEFFINSLAR